MEESALGVKKDNDQMHMIFLVLILESFLLVYLLN